mmetsp:Transcript_58440/g.92818  ORF Transcript_58440/g.92818 Transcript_58440/m.92818 type:complete len:222 (+) Transcript_58440:513-1178(+)
MKRPRITTAPNIPQLRMTASSSCGTLKYLKISIKTKMLSMLSDCSTTYPAANSYPASGLTNLYNPHAKTAAANTLANKGAATFTSSLSDIDCFTFSFAVSSAIDATGTPALRIDACPIRSRELLLAPSSTELPLPQSCFAYELTTTQIDTSATPTYIARNSISTRSQTSPKTALPNSKGSRKDFGLPRIDFFSAQAKEDEVLNASETEPVSKLSTGCGLIL